MKKLCLAVALVFSTLALLPQSAAAQDVKPINLALFTPIQIVPKDQSVSIFRFSLIYGRNVDVKYVDIGLVMKADRKTEGVQLGLVGLNHDFSGVQWTTVGYNTGTLVGVQLGAVNLSMGPESRWVQCCGVFNMAEDFEGLQFGFVNYTRDLKGVQLGLINIVSNGGLFGLPVFPFVNFNFD